MMLGVVRRDKQLCIKETGIHMSLLGAWTVEGQLILSKIYANSMMVVNNRAFTLTCVQRCANFARYGHPRCVY